MEDPSTRSVAQGRNTAVDLDEVVKGTKHAAAPVVLHEALPEIADLLLDKRHGRGLLIASHRHAPLGVLSAAEPGVRFMEVVRERS